MLKHEHITPVVESQTFSEGKGVETPAGVSRLQGFNFSPSQTFSEGKGVET